MAIRTDNQLITEANIIRDETAVGANTALRIGTMLDNVIDSKVNVDKISDDPNLGTSTTLVPTQNAVKAYADSIVVGLLDDRGNYDASGDVFPSSGGSGVGGAVNKGDIWYISVAGTLGGTAVTAGYSIRALVDNPAQTSSNWAISSVGLGYIPENEANRSTDATLGGATPSNVFYPTQDAVKTYVDSTFEPLIGYTTENEGNKSQDLIGNPTSTVLYPTNKAVADYVAVNSSGYKSYVANLTWDGANWGTSVIYYNNLGGAITLNSQASGPNIRLKLTSSGLFTLNKTIIIPCIVGQGQNIMTGTLDLSTFTPTINDIYVRWNNFYGAIATPLPFGVMSCVLEIRVYS